jgi:hypothetical protein
MSVNAVGKPTRMATTMTASIKRPMTSGLIG